MKRALVLGGGALLGAYDAGVIATLCREFPRGYINAIYMASVGIFQGLFYAANQPEIMEDTWRNHVHSRKLISWLKPVRRRRFLDLDYLVELFRGDLNDGNNRLDLDLVFSSGIQLFVVLTDYHTGRSILHQPTRYDVWDVMRGTCAIPGLYRPVFVNDQKVYDGGLSDAFPVAAALSAGYDEVIGVYNKSKTHRSTRAEAILSRWGGVLLPTQIAHLLRTMDARRSATETLFADPRVRIIRYEGPAVLTSMIDTHQERLNQAFDLGSQNAKSFIFLNSP